MVDSTINKLTITDEIKLKGAAGTDALIQKNATILRDELQIYAAGVAYGASSNGAGIHLYGDNDDQHSGNVALLTGGDGRMIVSERGNATIGRGIWDFVDTGKDDAQLTIHHPSGGPGICIIGANSTTEGDIAVPHTEQLSIGHWNTSSNSYTQRMLMDVSGNFTISNTGDVSLHLKADTDNSNESDNPVLKFSQDGELVTAAIGIDNGNDAYWDCGIANSSKFVFKANGSQVSEISRSGAYTDTSDARLKKNKVPISDALDLVRGITGYRHEWLHHEGIEFGLMAQEVREVAPELVSENAEGIYGLKYAKLIPVLIEAIKSQQTQIENLSK